VPRVAQEQPTGCTLGPHVESTLPQRMEEQPPTSSTIPLVDVAGARRSSRLAAPWCLTSSQPCRSTWRRSRRRAAHSRSWTSSTAGTYFNFQRTSSDAPPPQVKQKLSTSSVAPFPPVENRQPDSSSNVSVAQRNPLSLGGWPDTEQYKPTSVTAPLLPVAHRSTSIGRAVRVSLCMLDARKCFRYGLLLGKPRHGLFLRW